MTIVSQKIEPKPFAIKQVLVVEDNEGLNNLAQKSLRRAGFNCQGVLNGADAIERVKNDSNLILLIDQRLPDMDGTDLVRTLINQGYQIPFIAMTGHGDEKVAVDMMKLGARDYLVKGFDLTDILPMVVNRLFTELQTEQKLAAAEKTLRENETQYKALLETTKAIAYEVDLESLEFKYISPQIYKSTGYPAGMWKDFEFWSNTIHPDDREYCVDFCMTETKMGRDHEFEYRMVTSGDRIIWIKDLVSLIKKGDKPISLRGFLIDITQQKKMEAQLQQTQKMEAIGVLAGGIAHDFNNILFPIVGYTEMLLEDTPCDSPQRGNLNEIYTGALRASELVKQILTFSRQDSNEIKLIKIQPIIKEVLKLIRSTIPTNIVIKQNISNDCGIIKADATQIHQLVMNLATNAYHAMEDAGGELEVSLKEIELGVQDVVNPDMEPGPYAFLTVTDTGIGMDKDLTKKIFDPFYTTKELGKGTGLGLSVVHGIVNSAGGSINVYSEPGKGTEFHIYLPVVKSLPRQQEIQTKELIPIGTERILLVDDENAISSMGKQRLERLGYQVVALTSSLEALEIFRKNPGIFDVVITDMAMPNMPGNKLASELVKIRPDIPILLCTGFSEKINKEDAKAMGIKGFLMKPVAKFDMAQMVRKVLDGAKG